MNTWTTPCSRALASHTAANRHHISTPAAKAAIAAGHAKPSRADDSFFEFTWEMTALLIGIEMEDTAALMRNATTEAEKARTEIGEILNHVRAINEVVMPLLKEQVTEVRAARMTVVGEVHELIKPLRDIRKFFLESDYQFEMDRLERFVRVCKDLKDLKDSGILDAVGDIAIRLAIKEESR